VRVVKFETSRALGGVPRFNNELAHGCGLSTPTVGIEVNVVRVTLTSGMFRIRYVV
jgi:hypothetical protein